MFRKGIIVAKCDVIFSKAEVRLYMLGDTNGGVLFDLSTAGAI